MSGSPKPTLPPRSAVGHDVNQAMNPIQQRIGILFRRVVNVAHNMLQNGPNPPNRMQIEAVLQGEIDRRANNQNQNQN